MEKPLDEHIDDALEAIDNAQRVRARHRRQSDKGSEARQVSVVESLEILRQAMAPLRSELGRLGRGWTTAEQGEAYRKIREVSESIQAERRKLWKMRV